ncbi:hypothetical protein SLEP1_g13336 [Rubroshorea leprosula]|uniref:Uncharacterized protein n=1 Tax=Rubroshorea leprosula TaxID=152421 RepID=A0AAV5IFI1_9ROSI|nr:hypothetical protein SLEP1_g13336 [Rubroshorea leprosula]
MSDSPFSADYKPLENKDNSVDPALLKPGQIVKGNQNEVVCDLMEKERNSDGVPYVVNETNGWPASELDCSMTMNDLTNVKEKEAGNFLILQSRSRKNVDSFERDSDIYMDKSVMERQLPELVVCYKENICSVVKDICIDEGVPTQDKFLITSDMADTSICKFLPCENDQDTKMVEGKLDSDMSSPVVSLSPEQNISHIGIPDQCDPKDLRLTEEAKNNTRESTTMFESQELTLGELLLMPESGTESYDLISPSRKGIGVGHQLFQTSSEKQMLRPELVSTAGELNDGCEEMFLPSPALAPAVEESNKDKKVPVLSPAEVCVSEISTEGSLVNQVSNECKAETGSIPIEFDSSAPTASSREECQQNTYHELLETRNTSQLEDADGQLISNKLQHGHGESSFSTSTSLKCSSGPIAYSGSMSHRSDSSTTSTHSFAFPILQSEWNSSPVRMARADRKRFRKHGGWRQGLLCCRF